MDDRTAEPSVKEAMGGCTRSLAEGWGMGSSVTKGAPWVGGVTQAARDNVIGDKNKEVLGNPKGQILGGGFV